MLVMLIILKEQLPDKENRNIVLSVAYIMTTDEGDELADSLTKIFHALLT